MEAAVELGDRLYPPGGRHVVMVSSVPSGGAVAADGHPTRASSCSAVSDLWCLECPAGPGWGNHPDTPRKHTPNSVDKDNHTQREGGLFPEPAVSSGGVGHCVLRRHLHGVEPSQAPSSSLAPPAGHNNHQPEMVGLCLR